MKLKNNFFQIKDSYQTETGVDYNIILNPEHIIYQVHFPNNPITPGVCIIQIVKELSKEILKYDISLKKINNVKFLNIINPLENKEITFSISISSDKDNRHKINALVYNENYQFTKLSMLFLKN